MGYRSWASAFAAAGSITLFTTASAQAQASAAGSLSLERSLTEAQIRSLVLPAQERAAAAAREKAVAAGQRPDPVGRVAIENLPVDGDQAWSLSRDFMTNRSIGISQELTSRRRLESRRDRFERISAVEHAMGRLRLAELRRETARAWLARHYQERLLEMLTLQRDEAMLQVDAADAAYRGGGGRQTDLFSARAALAAIDEKARATEAKLEAARIALARWIGDAARHPLAAAPTIATVALAVRESKNPSNQRLLDHPMIAVLEQQQAVAHAAVDVARAERDPDWQIGLNYSQRGSAFSNMASISLSVPLPWNRANAQDRELSAALASADQREAELGEQRRFYDAQTRVLRANWRAGLERLAVYDQSLVPLAVERIRAALAAYRSGEASLDTFLVARRAEIELRTARLGLEADTADLWAQLEFLMPPDSDALGPLTVDGVNDTPCGAVSK